MRKTALVLGLGIFLVSFNSQAYLSAPGEVNGFAPPICLQVELTVGGVEEVVDLVEVLEANVHGACVELLVSGTEGNSFFLLAKGPFSFGVMAYLFEEDEPEDDVRVFRKCNLNFFNDDPMSVVVFFSVDDDVIPPWESVSSSLFQFGAYPLTEGLCE